MLNNYQRFEEVVQEKQFLFFPFIFFGILCLEGDNGIHRNICNYINLPRPGTPKPCDWIFLIPATRTSNPEMSLFSPSSNWSYYAESCNNGQLCCIDSAIIW